MDFDNTNDCLTNAFITIYKNSIWCMKYFLKSLSQVLLFAKEEISYNKSIDVISINNSADENYLEEISRQLPRYDLSMIETNNKRRRYRHRCNSQHSQEKINRISNKTRITVRSISNQNLNQTQSNHSEQKYSSNTLGTINSHIIVTPIHTSNCQNIASENDLTPNHINLREELADTLCRRSYEPLTFTNCRLCCGHCRPLVFPNVPFQHSDHYTSLINPQEQLNNEKELSQKSKQTLQMSDASETQYTPYSASPSIQSNLTNSPEDEPLSTGAIFHNEINEQNQSILSFPDHDTPQSEKSETLIDNDNQLKLSAQILVDDLIQNAEEKYQRILRMSIDQNTQHKSEIRNISHRDTVVNQIIKNESKSTIISDESNKENLSDDNKLCQELCNKLNLSNSNQITEIIRILASNAPHILKEQPSNKNPINNNSNTNKDNENILCRQLLLHPPFKPKRLIHLCPDGTIQVLSAVDENSNENQIINPQQYHLNYSNSAITPSIQQNHILSNESSLALEYENTVDLKTNFNHMMVTESISTQQSHSIKEKNSIVSLQQKQTLFKYDNLAKEVQFNTSHSKTVSQDDSPIININLDFNDEINNQDDENSLPEIFFKRIITPDPSIMPLNENSNQNKNDEMLDVRRKIHQKSRHNRSQSYANKKVIKTDR